MGKEPGGDKDISALQALFRLKAPTRNEIAAQTGICAVTVTDILNRLMERGLVEKSGKTRTHGGRPSALYQLSAEVGYVIGVSVEPQSFRVSAVDPRHEIICSNQAPLVLSSQPNDHVGEITKQISSELRSFMARPELKERRSLAIGLCLPGMVDTERGIWLHGLRVSGITHIPLRSIMEEAFGLPVVVEDVPRGLAYLQADRRWPEPTRSLVYLYLGSGVGTGILIDGELYSGFHGLAGEVGHMIVEEKGERCSCGNIGCLETVVSNTSILRRFRRRLEEGVISSLQRFNTADESLSLEAIREAAAAGDRLALSTLYEIGTFLGDACGKIIMLYNPRTLIIGGSVAYLGDFLREPIWNRIRQEVVPEMLDDLSLEIQSSLSEDEALGAALLGERAFWMNKSTASARIF